MSNFERFDVCVEKQYQKDGETKKTYIQVGSAFRYADSGGETIVLSAMPASTLDQQGNPVFVLKVFPPRDREAPRQSPAGQRPAQSRPAPTQEGFPGGEDDIPF